MTPKEKAQELVESMAFSCRECDYEAKAKQCALIAVDEMVEEMAFMCIMYSNVEFEVEERRFYWQEVKKEIEAL
jgi:hypothetical protein